MDTGVDVQEIADRLHERLETEIPKRLKSQLEKLGFDLPELKSESEEWPLKAMGVKRFLYPGNPEALCSYEYQGKPILGVRIIDGGIAFDVPKIETQNKEVQS